MTSTFSASSGVISGVLEGLKCAVGGGLVGAGLSAFALPVGIAIDIAISGTFGVLLILLLWVSGRFSLMAVLIGFTSEMLPGINAFSPGWSILVHNCIKNYNQRLAAGGIGKHSKLMGAFDVASMVPGAGAALTAVRPAMAVATRAANAVQSAPTPTRIPLQTKNFDGIRPANDNRPQRYAQVA